MSWTYSGDPANSRVDEIRFLIGDTNSDPDEQLLSDEEIKYSLLLYPVSTDVQDGDDTIIDRTTQPLTAAVYCAENIWARFQRQADERLPIVNFEYAARAKNYGILVKDLRNKLAAKGGVIPYVGGISKLDKQTNQDNDDRIKPDFYKHEHDNYGTTTAEKQNLLDLGD